MIFKKHNFRGLKNWNIRVVKSKKFSGFVSISPNKNFAIIYDMVPRPPDFLLHEYLHCAIRSLLRIDRRKIKDLRNIEEELVQDICALFMQARLRS
jgi:hypothetical protein